MTLQSIKLNSKHLLGYGFGSIGTGIFTTVPGMLLMFYMTNVLAIPAGKAALAVFVPKMWDVISDPILGMISDKTRSQWGRRPYLLVGALLTGLFFYLLFNVPLYDSVDARFWHVIVLYTLCATGYTIFAIPYTALPAEMTSNPHERTRIVSYRMTFLFVGIVISGGLSPVLVERYGGGSQGYGAMALLLGIIITAAMLTSFFSTKNIQLSASKLIDFTFQTITQGPLKNPSYLILFTAYALQVIGIGCLLASLPYYTLYVLEGSGEQLTIIFLALNITAIISIPGWLILSRRIGKVQSFTLAGLILIFSMIAFWFFSSKTTVFMVYLSIAVAGIGFAGQQIMGFALLPDLIDLDPSDRETENMAGIYTGIWVAGEKTGFAMSAFFVGTIFGIIGLIETTEGAVEQTVIVIETIKLSTTLLPAIMFSCGLLLIRLTRKKILI